MRVQIRRLDTRAIDFESEFRRLQHWSAQTDAAIEERVVEILAAVRERGDAAVLECTQRFDVLAATSMQSLELTQQDFAAAHAAITPAQRDALQAATARIRSYHERQLEHCGCSWSYRDEDGTLLGQKVTPLDRVGIYVPGGKAAYPSSLLMNAVPAHVAGVGEIVMVVPTPRGERNALVLAAAHVAGVTRAFTIGGAQAIAALAYGTETVPRVDKITGPGNIYVATAKRLVFGQVDIDMIAGPSEILVISDGSGDPAHLAADLLSQAEHDELASSILITTDEHFGRQVEIALAEQLRHLKRADIARQSLASYGAIIVARDLGEAAAFSNRLAPEHLELMVRAPREILKGITAAGAVFLGDFSPTAVGDYIAGPSHVLPTAGTARFFSPLGVSDFIRRMSVIELSKNELAELAPKAVRLARLEGLDAHARALEKRIKH